jgi:hypothetical protein
MKKIYLVVTFGIITLIVGIVMQNHRLEAVNQLDPSLRPPAVVMNIGQPQNSVVCAKIQDHLNDKKLSDLMLLESEIVQINKDPRRLPPRYSKSWSTLPRLRPHGQGRRRRF